MSGDPSKKKFIPIRRKLIYYVAAVVIFIALIILPIEAYRPITELYQLIENSKMLVAGIQGASDKGELEQMNQFLVDTLPDTLDSEELRWQHIYVSFTMLVTEGRLIEHDQILAKFEEAGVEIPGFNRADLEEAASFWRTAFAAHPGVFELFRKYKHLLIGAKHAAADVPFNVSDIYIMYDTGKLEGRFKTHISFLLDGLMWWETPAYPGEQFEIAGSEFWRASSLDGLSEYGHNPLFDPENYYLPRFDTDEWGAWFSVWYTWKVDNGVDIITIDFDASSVKETLTLVMTAVTIVGLLVLLLVVFVASWLSSMVTRPITELSKGSEEVGKGNYDYEVPVLSNDELGELTRRFNLMAKGQKERLNLKLTLEKLLSKELADKASQEGLVLGGKKTDCSVMFTDFAGFSTISQQMTASDAVNLLNLYFETLIPVIKTHGGFPDKYIGDAIVAIFGAPIYFEDHAVRIVRCAIEMQRKMRELNGERRRAGLPVFEMRIGINSGEVIVGAIGCDMKLEYTSIGETTNLANRMESACDIGHVMLAEGTRSRIIAEHFPGVEVDDIPVLVRVKGYPEPVNAYHVHVDQLEIGKNINNSIRDFYTYSKTEG